MESESEALPDQPKSRRLRMLQKLALYAAFQVEILAIFVLFWIGMFYLSMGVNSVLKAIFPQGCL